MLDHTLGAGRYAPVEQSTAIDVPVEIKRERMPSVNDTF